MKQEFVKFTIDNHPQRTHVDGMALENLNNCKPTLEYAVKHWNDNTTSTAEFKEYNINFFSVWLEMVNRRIKKLSAKKQNAHSVEASIPTDSTPTT